MHDTFKLLEDISYTEIKQALFQMDPWKALGPDGFPTSFFQKSWSIIGDIIVRDINHMWSNPETIKEVNQIKNCLIPKVPKPIYVQ